MGNIVWYWREEMKDYKSFFFFLEGTLLKNDQLLPNVIEFIGMLRKKNKQIFYITHHPYRSKELLQLHLQQIGLEVSLHQLITPVQAIQEYLLETTEKISVYIAGSSTLAEEISKINVQLLTSATEKTYGQVYVVLCLSNHIEEQQLQDAFQLLQRGAKLILINPEFMSDVFYQNIFDTGAIGRVLTGEKAATKKDLENIAKPSVWFQQVLINIIKKQHGGAVLIGHSVKGLISIGQAIGIDTVLISRDTSYVEEIQVVRQSPTWIVETLQDLYDTYQKIELV